MITALKSKLRGWLIRPAVSAMLVWSAPVVAQDHADTIYINGVVRTMEAADDVRQAVAVRNGRILATGSTQDLLGHAGAQTSIVDLEGRTMLPGFIDAHGHLSMLAGTIDFANLAPPPVANVRDIPSLQSTLREYIKERDLAPGILVQGFGYDDAQLAEQRHPTRQELDAVAADRPIMLLHASGHLAAGNTRALELAGLLRDAADPAGGVIRREADGTTASGVVEEAAMYRLFALLPRRTMDERMEALGRAQDIYAGYGITTAQDGAASVEDYELLKAADEQGALKIDVAALLFFRAEWPNLATMPIGRQSPTRLSIAGVKLLLDGSPQGRTAWLKEPYHQVPDDRPADYQGYRQVEDDVLRQWIDRAAANHWPLFVHVNGDAAMQQLIDMTAAARSAGSDPAQRTIAIHSQVVGDGQLAQMKALDIQPSFFAAHTFYWGDWHRDVTLGAMRAARISPMRDALDIGLVPTIHNDTPIVPPDIMRLVWAAVTRTTRSGAQLGIEEAATPYEALLMVTRNAAWQIGEEQDKGTIAVGKEADLVVLDADPLTTDPAQLDKIAVARTISDGVEVYGAGS
ncbi:amidohydrolase [Croceicoccus sp. F390]|uniref:Amidohydrolase n=1 Tax=Croceicoccus esteveae TaxID=3075597 RepID=A0ABU2ZIA5_9SPHN|nr:amidohydrolase [Croceicoccus sp. F390]MDT0575946.1 amidohydrolase [Croceicoccus sp. F390]